MIKYKNQNIQTKFLTVMIVAVTIFVGIVTILSFVGSKSELEKVARQNLEVLSESVYQSMTNSMLSGDQNHVKKAKEDATKLKSVDYLDISKSKMVIKDFGLNEKYTSDSEVLGVFKSKKPIISEVHDKNHQMKILKPFIAEARCLNCHVSAKEGDVLGVLDLRVSLEDSDKNIAYFTTMISLSNLFLGVVLLITTMILLKHFVIKPLYEMYGFIKKLSSGSRDLTKRVPIKSEDELGKISKEFNKYLEKIEKNYKKERDFIQKANQTIENVKHGSFDKIITADIDSKTLSKFKNSVNDMILTIRENFKKINRVLEEYKNYNYKNDVVLDNIAKQSDFDILIKHINGLKSVITNMLIENKKNGLILDKTSDTLLDNVNILDKNSSKTESSLEEANSALKKITDNISLNNLNVNKMSNLSKIVTSSAKVGEELANQTVISMEEINKQVSQINEAISIIDQIAFQTNILSLNAAVEAATAGDAGKGFAVVASEVRNLASKSAEAAQNIKELVESATKVTVKGKEIANQMIDGYESLNKSIENTTKYITDIEKASNEQLNAIELINTTIKKVTIQTKENSKITKTTKDIAVKTDKMAKYTVKKVDEIEFMGKEKITMESIN
jgi:methyl-accepting chemotaxis protein